MYSTSSGGRSSSVSLCQQEFETTSQLQQPLHIGVGVQSPQADHSLHADLNLMAPSPNSLTMYDHDQSILQRASCTSEDPLSPSLDFDLKPQFECTDDNLFKFDLATLNSAFGNLSGGDEPVLKLEDVFQVEKRRDIAQGPTLAELNFENSVTMPGFLEETDTGLNQQKHAQSYTVAMSRAEQQQPKQQQNVPQTSVEKTPNWSTTSFLTAFLTRPALNSFRPQSSQATHTVSSPTIVPGLLGVKQEASDKLGCEVSGRFTLANVAAEINTTNAESKSALADLLTQTPTPTAVGGVTLPVQIKTESDMKLQPACQHSANLTVLTPVKRGTKRSISPDGSSNNSVERKWEEIKQFIHDDEAPTFQTSNDEPLIKKIKTEPEDVAYNPVDDSGSDDDYDSDLDQTGCLSDAESTGSSVTEEYSGTAKRDKRYFWQYNTQSKGPKGKRLCKSVTAGDPHILTTFEDPVFDPDLNQSQYKHNGKARKGDGNDITPNPNKLYNIGKELKKLNRVINDITPPSELPTGVRPKTRKEKNKLASRACRLKKKAQHEANKVKLYGLEREHQKLVHVLEKLKWETAMRIQDPSRSLKGETLTLKLDRLTKRYLGQMVAGNSTEYVNTVLAKVTAGDKTGGL